MVTRGVRNNWREISALDRNQSCPYRATLAPRGSRSHYVPRKNGPARSDFVIVWFIPGPHGQLKRSPCGSHRDWDLNYCTYWNIMKDMKSCFFYQFFMNEFVTFMNLIKNYEDEPSTLNFITSFLENSILLNLPSFFLTPSYIWRGEGKHDTSANISTFASQDVCSDWVTS